MGEKGRKDEAKILGLRCFKREKKETGEFTPSSFSLDQQIRIKIGKGVEGVWAAGAGGVGERDSGGRCPSYCAGDTGPGYWAWRGC